MNREWGFCLGWTVLQQDLTHCLDWVLNVSNQWIHECMWVHACVHVCVWGRERVCACMYIVCVCVCACVCACFCVHVVCACVHVYLFVCVHVEVNASVSSPTYICFMSLQDFVTHQNLFTIWICISLFPVLMHMKGWRWRWTEKVAFCSLWICRLTADFVKEMLLLHSVVCFGVFFSPEWERFCDCFVSHLLPSLISPLCIICWFVGCFVSHRLLLLISPLSITCWSICCFVSHLLLISLLSITCWSVCCFCPSISLVCCTTSFFLLFLPAYLASPFDTVNHWMNSGKKCVYNIYECCWSTCQTVQACAVLQKRFWTVITNRCKKNWGVVILLIQESLNHLTASSLFVVIFFFIFMWPSSFCFVFRDSKGANKQWHFVQ